MIRLPETYRAEYREAAAFLRRCHEWTTASILGHAAATGVVTTGEYAACIRAYGLYLELDCPNWRAAA